MSQPQIDSNRELVEQAYQAFNDGDIETVTSFMADDIEWIEPEGLTFGGTHRGADTVVEDVFGPTMSQLDDLELTIDRIVDAGDTMVVLGRATGTATATGTDLTAQFAHVHDIADGKIERFTQYTDTFRWRDAIEA